VNTQEQIGALPRVEVIKEALRLFSVATDALRQNPAFKDTLTEHFITGRFSHSNPEVTFKGQGETEFRVRLTDNLTGRRINFEIAPFRPELGHCNLERMIEIEATHEQTGSAIWVESPATIPGNPPLFANHASIYYRDFSSEEEKGGPNTIEAVHEIEAFLETLRG